MAAAGGEGRGDRPPCSRSPTCGSAQAKKPESAAPILERVLEFDPANRDAYERVLSLYSDAGDWRAYAQAVDRYLPNLVTDEDKIRRSVSWAGSGSRSWGRRTAPSSPSAGRSSSTPPTTPCARTWSGWREETGSYEELAAVYEQVADELPRGPLAERLYLVLARVQDRNLDDPGEAEAALRKILEFDPTNASALDAMAQMFGRRGRDRELHRLPGAEDRGRAVDRGAKDTSSGKSPASTSSG